MEILDIVNSIIIKDEKIDEKDENKDDNNEKIEYPFGEEFNKTYGDTEK